MPFGMRPGRGSKKAAAVNHARRLLPSLRLLPQGLSRLRPVRLLRICLLTTAMAAALGGCGIPAFMSFPPQVRGNNVDADALKQLVPGTSTRADVTAAIGSPSAHASFDDDTWIYIGQITKPVIAGTQAVRDQQVYVMNFGPGGVLTSIEHRGMKDSQDVDVVSRVTPSPGSNASFMQQLLGNVGKFSPGGTTGGSGGGGGLSGGGGGNGGTGASF